MGKRDPRGVVRVNEFDRSLDLFNAEIGQKMAAVLAKFHEEHVQPIEDAVGEEMVELQRRIDRLELLTGIRALRWVRRQYLAIMFWWTSRKEAEAPAEEQPTAEG